MDKVFRETLHRFVEVALSEDVGSGDHTTLSTIDREQGGEATLVVKETGVIAGVEIAREMVAFIDPKMEVKLLIKDGRRIELGDAVLTMKGRIHSILKIERLMLNVMQRMSGIATKTSRYVQLLEGTETKVLDTRKTTPGMRFLEKEAVKVGGGVNHRFGLYDMILIKDNHVDYAGGIKEALKRAFDYRRRNNLNIPIEIEVRDLKELEQVLASEHVDRVMLDNFTPELVAEAIVMVDGKLVTEASGGITLSTVRAFAEAGVDFVSVGELTHTVKSLDLSLKAKIL